jgi:CheY-like chemotaxis protein
MQSNQSRGRILVMDDDENIRVITGCYLDRCGFSADFAEDGKQAVELYATSLSEGRRYSAVIMDLSVPGRMGGLEAIACIAEIDPHLVAFISSGSPEYLDHAEMERLCIRGILPKPFGENEISQLIEAIAAS